MKMFAKFKTIYYKFTIISIAKVPMVATSTKLIVKFSSENNCKKILDKRDFPMPISLTLFQTSNP